VIVEDVNTLSLGDTVRYYYNIPPYTKEVEKMFTDIHFFPSFIIHCIILEWHDRDETVYYVMDISNEKLYQISNVVLEYGKLVRVPILLIEKKCKNF